MPQFGLECMSPLQEGPRLAAAKGCEWVSIQLPVAAQTVRSLRALGCSRRAQQRTRFTVSLDDFLPDHAFLRRIEEVEIGVAGVQQLLILACQPGVPRQDIGTRPCLPPGGHLQGVVTCPQLGCQTVVDGQQRGADVQVGECPCHDAEGLFGESGVQRTPRLTDAHAVPGRGVRDDHGGRRISPRGYGSLPAPARP